MNWGGVIGGLIGVCVVIILACFFMLTWDFWLGLSGLIEMT